MRKYTDHDRRRAEERGIPVEELFKRNEPLKRFYKWGIDIADSKYPCYGGHTHWICNLLNINYLMVGLCFKLSYYSTFYDGMHHCLNCGFFYISWGDWRVPKKRQ